MGLTDLEFEGACQNLAKLLPHLNRWYGTPYCPDPDAPDTYEDLVKAYTALDRGDLAALPVYDGGSDNTIYPSPRHNHLFRAWHDTVHYLNDFDFSPEGEEKTVLRQRRQLAELALAVAPSMPIQPMQILLWAEVMGQQAHRQKFGRFPENQLGFVRAFVRDSDSALDAGPW